MPLSCIFLQGRLGSCLFLCTAARRPYMFPGLSSVNPCFSHSLRWRCHFFSFFCFFIYGILYQTGFLGSLRSLNQGCCCRCRIRCLVLCRSKCVFVYLFYDICCILMEVAFCEFFSGYEASSPVYHQWERPSSRFPSFIPEFLRSTNRGPSFIMSPSRTMVCHVHPATWFLNGFFPVRAVGRVFLTEVLRCLSQNMCI